ncbi:unnamed protein product [Enterobius vermicularis]|uniref:Jumonji domain-containing protein 4 n=1 Tax=Enterobius vermicularis TaxID=51028 RepID=A0A158Q9L5_ENTVE|nr:unnamed protein product [Enterobius vermicularis]
MLRSEKEQCSEAVPKFDVEATHWIDLFVDFMLQNKPCILKSTATRNWKSRKEWVLENYNNNQTPNFDYFSTNYGELIAPLADEEAEERTDTRVSEYMQYAKETGSRRNIRYLKDWHFQNQSGSAPGCDLGDSGTSYEFYDLQSFLNFDWINNEQWSGDKNCFGDYRFVYFGVKDSWTVLHSDVMSSYSWSANICGRKLWYFVPIGNEEYFKICRDTYVRDIRTMPDKWEAAKIISFIQEPGEIVFVPSNWYHQVHNLGDAVSINHNFFNASNINRAFSMVCERLKDVCKEIEDVRGVFTKEEFENQCQVTVACEKNKRLKLLKNFFAITIFIYLLVNHERDDIVFQMILKADIRINFQMLLDLVKLVVADRQKKVDQCWICCRHPIIFDCKKDRRCMEYMKSYVKCRCECSGPQLCKSCTRFINMYELTCASQCCSMIQHYAE